MSRVRVLDEALFNDRPETDKRHCYIRLVGGAHDGLACGKVASHEIAGGFYCPHHAGRRALEILTADPLESDEEAIWVRFVDALHGRHIVKWDRRPFEGGQRYERRD